MFLEELAPLLCEAREPPGIPLSALLFGPYRGQRGGNDSDGTGCHRTSALRSGSNRYTASAVNTSGVWPGARNAVADLSYDAGVPPYSHDTGEKSETAIRSLYSDQIELKNLIR